MAMIAALELNDLVAFGIAPCQPDRRHHSLGARAYKAQFFDEFIVLQQLFCQLIFQSRWRTEGHAVLHYFDHLLFHFWMIVPEDKRPPGTAEIDELVAIGIPNVAAIAFGDKKRCAINRFERPYR